jgi:hypothetical protein
MPKTSKNHISILGTKKFKNKDPREKLMSSVFNIHRLPLEVRLEIFGCLAHADWTRLAAHNRRTGKVLMGNTRYLAPLPQIWLMV